MNTKTRNLGWSVPRIDETDLPSPVEAFKIDWPSLDWLTFAVGIGAVIGFALA